MNRLRWSILALAVAVGAVIAVIAGAGSVERNDRMPTPEPGRAERPVEGRPPQVLMVSLDGQDSHPGTSARPLRTLQRAAALAEPGSTIYVREGTYRREQAMLDASGTPDAPILVRPHPGETVVFDAGADVLRDRDRWFDAEGLITIRGSHVVFEGFEVRNSPGVGILVQRSENVVIRDNHVHHAWSNGIQVSGRRLRTERNHVHHTSMNNYEGARRGSFSGWSGGISSNLTGGGRSTQVRHVGNRIHDIWGECLGALHVSDYVIADNDVSDCWSVNIYLDNSSDGVIERNFSHTTSQWRPAMPGRGLAWANEPYETTSDLRPTENLTIRNNFFARNRPIAYITEGRENDTYRNVKFIGNTLFRQKFEIGPAPAGAPVGNVAANNIFDGGVMIAQPDGWQVTHNNFPDGNEQGIRATSLAPGFRAPDAAGVDGLRLARSSPLRRRGVALAELGTDFFGAPRRGAPTLGAHQLP